MSTAKLSAKSQIVLPAEVRKKLGLRPGDRLLIEADEDHAIIRKAPASFVDALERLASPAFRDYARELARARHEWDD